MGNEYKMSKCVHNNNKAVYSIVVRQIYIYANNILDEHRFGIKLLYL